VRLRQGGFHRGVPRYNTQCHPVSGHRPVRAAGSVFSPTCHENVGPVVLVAGRRGRPCSLRREGHASNAVSSRPATRSTSRPAACTASRRPPATRTRRGCWPSCCTRRTSRTSSSRKRRRTERRTTMKVFVAGATGAIGRPLVAELVRQGHAVTGMTRLKASTQGLKELGAEAALVDALDAAAVEEAVRKSAAEAVIDQLTSLPKSPADMAAARAIDRRLRIEGGSNLRRAALACGVHRYVQQSSGFFLAPGEGLADEAVGMA